MPDIVSSRATASAVVIFAASAAASASWPQLRAFGASPRHLQGEAPSGCRSVALRLMPTPSINAYEQCFRDKLSPNSTHDWSVPGAEILAQFRCWCQHNLTETMEEYQCCDHPDIYPMCSVQCNPDCSSALAQDCIRSCPSMCFEAAEYVINVTTCASCNWTQCWPVLSCLADHAIDRVEEGTLERTCHEGDFEHRPELQEYWKCWKNAPKHSSHWNVLSSIVHCICREGMKAATNETACCRSSVYSGGTCELECATEAMCASQEAQTCIHGCQLKCPSLQMTPSQECARDCISADSRCRKYVSCRPPSTAGYRCDDGRWPEASTGCCVHELETSPTIGVGCPTLCESERLWRLDRKHGKPWWARWHDAPVAQCTCHGCPSTEANALDKLKVTVDEGLYYNGQHMLLDIAKRSGLKYGPNRRMQALMVERNDEISEVMMMNLKAFQLDRRIGDINSRYSAAIIQAAQDYPDDGNWQPPEAEDEDVRSTTPIVLLLACTAVILAAVACATCVIVRSRRKANDISTFQGESVVVGQPVSENQPEVNSGIVIGGAPVLVSAPMKQPKA